MPSRRLILRHALFSVAVVLLYLLLNRPEVMLVSHLGFTAWYPASGLIFAVMLAISPWYALLIWFSDSLATVLIYHEPLMSYTGLLGSVAIVSVYAFAAYLLRGPLRIDLGLRRRQDVVRFIFMTMSAALVSAAAGVGCLLADRTIQKSEFWASASGWFFGDGIGLLGFAPFLLIHVFPWVRRELLGEVKEGRAAPQSKSRGVVGNVIEASAQAGALAAVIWIMFGPTLRDRELFYLSFIPVIWIAMRQGIRRVVTALVVFNFGIVVGLHILTPNPSSLTKISLLMLSVSAVGLIVGSVVTERHRMGKELHQRTSYLNSLIENSPLGIAVLDCEGRVELTNPAFSDIFLYAQEELAGRNLDVLLSPGDVPADESPLSSLVLAGQKLHKTGRRRRKNGQILHVEFHATPLMMNGAVVGAYTIYKDISEQIKASEAEHRHAQSLNLLVEELELRTQQMVLLNEMGSLLECCGTTQEACAVVSGCVRKLFPQAQSGALYLFKSSRNVVENAAGWGELSPCEETFAPDACWALRRSRPHWSEPEEGSILCAHLKGRSRGKYLCVPMVAQSETIGVLLIEFAAVSGGNGAPGSAVLQESEQRLAVTAAGQIALSLASLRLREKLRDQSIRDPLTGLFNRRFMEESLERELLRAARKKHPVSILFLDLDHFKRFNDTFGHDAGDLVLRSVAELFRNFFRADDVICRYGGEEFAILLPKSSTLNAASRAESLREEVKRLKLLNKDQILGTVTVSIGISTFPEHGGTASELMKAADQCLYQAKKSGRDAVAVAGVLA